MQTNTRPTAMAVLMAARLATRPCASNSSSRAITYSERPFKSGAPWGSFAVAAEQLAQDEPHAQGHQDVGHRALFDVLVHRLVHLAALVLGLGKRILHPV